MQQNNQWQQPQQPNMGQQPQYQPNGQQQYAPNPQGMQQPQYQPNPNQQGMQQPNMGQQPQYQPNGQQQYQAPTTLVNPKLNTPTKNIAVNVAGAWMDIGSIITPENMPPSSNGRRSNGVVELLASQVFEMINQGSLLLSNSKNGTQYLNFVVTNMDRNEYIPPHNNNVAPNGRYIEVPTAYISVFNNQAKKSEIIGSYIAPENRAPKKDGNVSNAGKFSINFTRMLHLINSQIISINPANGRLRLTFQPLSQAKQLEKFNEGVARAMGYSQPNGQQGQLPNYPQQPQYAPNPQGMQQQPQYQPNQQGGQPPMMGGQPNMGQQPAHYQAPVPQQPSMMGGQPPHYPNAPQPQPNPMMGGQSPQYQAPQQPMMMGGQPNPFTGNGDGTPNIPF